MLRASSVLKPANNLPVPFDSVVLDHGERHVRRKALALQHGEMVNLDLPEPIHLEDGDRIVLNDGRHAEVIAAKENLIEIRATNPVHHAELCWHIGNRHLSAQIEADRILILRDHVIADMLRGLGATVSEVAEAFHPTRGAYHNHSHDSAHRQAHHHHSTEADV